MVRSIVIPQNPAHAPTLVEFAEIGDFQRLVGGWLEPLELPSLGVTVYANEDARREQRLLNMRATAFWWLYSAQPLEYPLILGDVVLTGAGGSADGTDIPERVADHIFARDDFVVQVCLANERIWVDSFARFSSIFDAAIWCLLFEATMRAGALFRVSGEPSLDLTADQLPLGGERPW